MTLVVARPFNICLIIAMLKTSLIKFSTTIIYYGDYLDGAEWPFTKSPSRDRFTVADDSCLELSPQPHTPPPPTPPNPQLPPPLPPSSEQSTCYKEKKSDTSYSQRVCYRTAS